MSVLFPVFFFSSCKFMSFIGSIAVPSPLGTMVAKKLFLRR